MLRKKRGRVEWLEFELLADIPELVHGLFLRQGGASEAPFNSLNAGGGSGDEPSRIELNRKKIEKIIGCPLVSSKQCHGAVVEEVPLSQEVCDGLITDQKGYGLVIKHADCQSAIFYDPIQKVVANVHAGWRGNVQAIYTKAIGKFYKRYGSKPENLLVSISPSLGPCCAEFINYKRELPPPFWAFQPKPTYFDLWEIARQELLSCNILPHHIQIASICTFCNKEDFFSYRRDKVTGRNATVVALKCRC